MNFYALYSKSQQCYNTPFLAHDNQEAIAIISKTVVAQQDPALVMSLDDLRLDQVGEFRPREVFPCSSSSICTILNSLEENLPLPPMIKSQVDKIYARKETSDGTAAQ